MYSILQLLCADTLCLQPFESSQIGIGKIVVAKMCRNHACYPRTLQHSRDLKMAATFLNGHTLNNVSALSTALGVGRTAATSHGQNKSAQITLTAPTRSGVLRFMLIGQVSFWREMYSTRRVFSRRRESI